jgi:hypothetical protein
MMEFAGGNMKSKIIIIIIIYCASNYQFYMGRKLQNISARVLQPSKVQKHTIITFIIP